MKPNSEGLLPKDVSERGGISGKTLQIFHFPQDFFFLFYFKLAQFFKPFQVFNFLSWILTNFHLNFHNFSKFYPEMLILR